MNTMRGIVFSIAVVLTAQSAQSANIWMCESESMVLDQVYPRGHGHAQPRVVQLTGAVFYYDTITVPGAIRLRTLTDGIPGETDYVIRKEAIIQEDWDNQVDCSLYMRYDADLVMSNGFD